MENKRTLAESRVPVGELSGGVTTMHVVIRPPLPDKNNGTFWIHVLVFLPLLMIINYSPVRMFYMHNEA